MKTKKSNTRTQNGEITIFSMRGIRFKAECNQNLLSSMNDPKSAVDGRFLVRKFRNDEKSEISRIVSLIAFIVR